MSDCIFCKILQGVIPAHKVWEDEHHIAILNITPRYKGNTVVLSKSHLPSNLASLDDKTFSSIWVAAKSVAKRLELAFAVDRCAFIAEGTGVDHAHIKLYPLHGYKPGFFHAEPYVQEVLETYPGFISSQEGPKSSDSDLARIAKIIRGDE